MLFKTLPWDAATYVWMALAVLAVALCLRLFAGPKSLFAFLETSTERDPASGPTYAQYADVPAFY